VTVTWRSPRRDPAADVRVLRNGAVVGQSSHGHLKVRVSAGRRYTVAAGIVGTHGRAPACYARTHVGTPSVRLAAPTVALRPGASAVTLSWLAVPHASAYRVLRNGVVLGQTRTLSYAVKIAAGRIYALKVAAVDAAGNVGVWSRSVIADLAHRVPATPLGLGVVSTGQTTLSVAWAAASGGSSPIAAYRVYKNGAVVAQTSARTMTLGSLAPDRTYGVQVAAVDSQGYVSPPSAAIHATTAMPDRSTGKARLFVLASTESSIADFESHYKQVSAIYPTYFDCDPATGNFVGTDDPSLDQFAQQRGISVLVRLNCQGTTLVHNMLTNPTMRANAIQSAAALVATHRYTGVDMDFEAGAAADRTLYTQFVTDMVSAVHAVGGTVTVDASPKTYDQLNHPRSTFFDYTALGSVADEVVVMSWGLHWSTSAPGPSIDLRWFSQVYQYVASLPSRSRFVLGAPFYAQDWANGGGPANPATQLTYSQVQALIAQTGAQPVLDSASDEWHFTYIDGQGQSHDVWFVNAQSLNDHFGLATPDGLAGIALWRAGQEDPSVWSSPALGGTGL
jgi:spore germination protein YaaH